MKVLIYGCGGHGRVVLDILRAQAGESLDAVFVDDNASLEGSEVDGALVLGRGALPALLHRGFAAVIGIGDNHTRAALYSELRNMGFPAAPAIHSSAIISPLAVLEPGVVLMPGAIVNTGARICENACVNTAASVDHDAIVEAHAHLFPGVRLTGNVRVGRYATVATGAVVLPGVRIGENALVGAAALVREDVPDGAVVYGVPARLVRFQRSFHSLCAS